MRLSLRPADFPIGGDFPANGRNGHKPRQRLFYDGIRPAHRVR